MKNIIYAYNNCKTLAVDIVADITNIAVNKYGNKSIAISIEVSIVADLII